MPDDETGSTGDSLSPQAQLARRLNLLLDVVVAERGKPVTFREVQDRTGGQGHQAFPRSLVLHEGRDAVDWSATRPC